MNPGGVPVAMVLTRVAVLSPFRRRGRKLIPFSYPEIVEGACKYHDSGPCLGLLYEVRPVRS